METAEPSRKLFHNYAIDYHSRKLFIEKICWMYHYMQKGRKEIADMATRFSQKNGENISEQYQEVKNLQNNYCTRTNYTEN
jgi:hypothetical protein